MSANYIYEPVIHNQVAAVSSIEIEHGFGRRVNVAVKDNTTDERIYPKIEESLDTGESVYNKVTISFYKQSALSAVGNWTAVIS